MYNDLQDALGYRTDQNAPFNPTWSLPNAVSRTFRLDTAAAFRPPAQTRARRSSAESADADADFLVAARAAGDHGQHRADRRLCRHRTAITNSSASMPTNRSRSSARHRPARPIIRPLFPRASPARPFPPALTMCPPPRAPTPPSPTPGPGSPKATALTTPCRSMSITASAAASCCAASIPGRAPSTTAIRSTPPLRAANPRLHRTRSISRADRGLANFDVRHTGVINAVTRCRSARGKALWRLDRQHHRHPAGRLPFHAAAQLQSFEQRRHAQSRCGRS